MEMETGRRRKRTKLFDIEWAKSLKGVSMKVPDNWWTSCNDRILHDGKIDSFDQSTQKMILLVDSNFVNCRRRIRHLLLHFRHQKTSHVRYI